ncbi:MAG: RsfS/YbeB/iojap family protein, partial [Rubrivivax sp.]|nr:RsfS/YbeB/iojap family protein [Rubrivivax sp.]
DNAEWIIVDCGAAVAHIMQPAIRDYYHLEEIWGAKPVRLKGAADGRAAPPRRPAGAEQNPGHGTPTRPASVGAAPVRAGAREAGAAGPASKQKAASGAAPAKSAPAKKAPVRKAPASKVAGKKALAKKAPAKKAPAKNAAGARSSGGAGAARAGGQRAKAPGKPATVARTGRPAAAKKPAPRKGTPRPR